MEEARQLASALSSHDIVESRDARQQLARFISPERLVEMWQQGQEQIAAALLEEAESVGNDDVYMALGDGFKSLFDPAANMSMAEQFLVLDTTHIVARFLVNGIASEDLTKAAYVRPALLALLTVVPPTVAPAIGELVSASLKTERVLRLFDENNPESSENEKLCKFLLTHTDLISFITSSTANAFDNDPLLVANYMAISAIIGRHEKIPIILLDKIEKTLVESKDDFVFCFVCRACAVALRHHDSNALNFAVSWVTAAANRLMDCSHDAYDAIYDLLGAASTTSTGWNSVQSLLKEERIKHGLNVAALRAITLNFLDVLVQSPHVENSFFSLTLLHAVWQLRNDPNDTVREKLWEFLNDGIARENIINSMESLCASFLCSPQQEANVAIRELQLRVATRLVSHARLPGEVMERLRQFISRGLYPPSSVGMEAMSRH
ncbi:uncharacterized protein TM35_000481210 [Trypanosoma theileri]|uniref:Uncharacterized protein n=1 Tax=Trypanosoma theileri TaxID=67003 RepID=A0A1X0NJ75_9TRYP|nr:uncharacterized protein TM35_000481210 [Trypanosoma theileri]ORC84160.1 hypothetical protein TM35_000481210 [Trypanosoma theileri]